LTYRRHDVYDSRSCGMACLDPSRATALIHLSREAGGRASLPIYKEAAPGAADTAPGA
jgi:hypothetical protein